MIRHRHTGASRLIAAAVLWLAALHTPALADTLQRQVRVAPGHTVRVAIYTAIRPDCTSGQLPTIKLAAAPVHGTVSVRRGTLKATNFKQCLATEVPAFVAFYRAAAAFNGSDDFELEVTAPSGRKQLEHFHVSIADARGGQGI